MSVLKRISVIALMVLFLVTDAISFCGFYVAQLDVELFNDKSEIILVRDGTKTVITMSNDFKGDVKDFAMVVPVPEVLKKEQVKTVNKGIFSRLSSYSGPRLVEYHDYNPCAPMIEVVEDAEVAPTMKIAMMSETVKDKNRREYKVTIEEEYTVGEYNILVLSAEESEGLKSWLVDNDYKIPEKAERVLEPYIKSNMKFFVVKVDLSKVTRSIYGYVDLSPLQISFNSDRFMLPLRLGMANSNGEQDMIVYAFTKNGRIEAANYRTVKVPTDRKIPTFIRNNFNSFYKDLFEKQYKREGRNTVFLEYAWNVSPSWGGAKCDPCVGLPPVFSDFQEAGVDWVSANNGRSNNVFFTRLHVRYSEDRFPEDLFFIETPNKEHFQGRYVITNPARGSFDCEAGQQYLGELRNRRKQELMELAALTDWNTDVYTQYVESGSAATHTPAKKEEVAPGVAFPDDGGNGPMSPIFLFVLSFVGIVLFLFLRYPSVAHVRR